MRGKLILWFRRRKLGYSRGVMRYHLLLLLALAADAAPAAAQQLPNEGQSAAAYVAFVAGKPEFAAEVQAFEAWQRRKGVYGILPTWQVLRTASMWRPCNGPPFEVPPVKLWAGIARTLRFVRDHVGPALGPLQAVSAYRNPQLNVCAGGAAGSAHRDFTAMDLVPDKPLSRRQIFDAACRVHRGKGPAHGVGLGFYAFTRFHVDTRSYRRWGSAGPAGNESPCDVLERGGDPEAPPLPRIQAPAEEVPSPAASMPPVAPNR